MLQDRQRIVNALVDGGGSNDADDTAHSRFRSLCYLGSGSSTSSAIERIQSPTTLAYGMSAERFHHDSSSSCTSFPRIANRPTMIAPRTNPNKTPSRRSMLPNGE